MKDTHQARYLAHQKRKRTVLLEIMQLRHSNRIFSDKIVESVKLDALHECVSLCPSSCDRRGVYLSRIENRDEKELLGGLLVGGVGWIHRAPVIFLLFGSISAYKAGDEISYMPYLDAGVIVQQMFLTATAYGLHAAYVNPNIRRENRDFFVKRFNNSDVFCGAFAIGYPP